MYHENLCPHTVAYIKNSYLKKKKNTDQLIGSQCYFPIKFSHWLFNMLNDFHVLISSAHTLFGVLSASVICSVKVKLLVTLSYWTLGDCMGCSLPGSSVHGILQARILDWVAIPSSRGSSWPTDWTQVSCTAVRFFTIWAIRKAHHLPMSFSKIFALFILIWRSLYMWVISTHIYCVIHNKLWKILKEMGIPDHLTCLSRNLYAGQEATGRIGHRTTDWFQIGKGVRQGWYCHPAYLTYMQSTSWECWAGRSTIWNQDGREKYQ